MQRYTTCLTIAGSDSSGGAGIQADLKTFSALSCYGMTVITAITAQNTCGVQEVLTLPTNIIIEQLKSIFSDIKVDAIKIGMLANSEIITAIAENLPKNIPIILDPVMVASSGDRLLEESAITDLQQKLFPLAALITPNVFEAEILSGIKITDQSSVENAAEIIQKNYSGALLIKGGHLKHCQDQLFMSGETTVFPGEYIETRNTHGTGCSLSSAIACGLAKNKSLPDAISAAKNYLQQALESGRDYHLGHGHGPIQHFYSWWNNETL